MNTEENTLLAKWLSGEITPEELEQLQKEVDLSTLEDVLKQQKNFDIETRPTDAMWEKFQNQLPDNPPSSPTKNRYWLLGLLVLILAGLGLWFYFSQNKNQKIETAPAKTETKVYADGTQIQLSPNSSIEYDESQWSSHRSITLDGQAYFDVAKGSPFRVHTPQGQIEVLGTQFDIWEMGNIMRVQCYEGSVKVTSQGKSKTLTAQEQIIVNKNRLGNVVSIDFNQPDWLQNQRIYEEVPLRWVLKDVERFYDVKTDASVPNIDEDFSGVIPINDQKKALDYLTKTVNWTYEIKNETIYFTPSEE